MPAVGRSDDLEAAGRLIESHADVSASVDELADVDSDLSAIT